MQMQLSTLRRAAMAILPVALVGTIAFTTATSNLSGKTMSIAGRTASAPAKQFDKVNYAVPTATTPLLVVAAEAVVDAAVLIVEEDPTIIVEVAEWVTEQLE